jgi:hypothetical protein
VIALNSRRRKLLCVEACRGIPDAALRAGGLQQALMVAQAALGLAPMQEQIDIDLIRATIAHLSFTPRERKAANEE